jgi:hypothetical protein
MKQEFDQSEMQNTNPRDFFRGLIHCNNPYAAYLFQWVEYREELHTYRLKMPHDIRLKNGKEYMTASPNANSWHTTCGEMINDKKVTHVRLSKNAFGYGEDEWEFTPKINTPLV